MMLQDWVPESIRFLEDAVAHSDYYLRLAEKIAAYLPTEAHICDAGCGLGELSIALIPYCAYVTAVDRASAPIEALRHRISKREKEKLEIRCTDVLLDNPRVPYDAMVFCLFGGMEETLRAAAAQCAGPVILIKRDYMTHQFSSGGTGLEHFTAETAERELSRRRIPYQAERFELELGQPFRSLEAAEMFFHLYNRGTELSAEKIAHMLEKTSTPEFPYYLPNRKKLGLLAFQSDDIRRIQKGEKAICTRSDMF